MDWSHDYSFQIIQGQKRLKQNSKFTGLGLAVFSRDQPKHGQRFLLKYKYKNIMTKQMSKDNNSCSPYIYTYLKNISK
jgi:hypothetical protein